MWLEANGIRPMTCKTFESYRPEVCAGCPLRGMITSPITAPAPPTVKAELSSPPPTAAAPAPEPAPAPKEYVIPTFTGAFSKVNQGGCWVKRSGEDGSAWDLIYEYAVYPIQKIKDRTMTGDIQVSYIFRKHHASGFDDIQITGETLLGNGLNGYLGSVGFLLADKDRKRMAGLLIDILRHAEASLEETTVADNLGWDEDFKNPSYWATSSTAQTALWYLSPRAGKRASLAA